MLKIILEIAVAFATITGWKKSDDFKKEMDAIYAPLYKALNENYKINSQKQLQELTEKLDNNNIKNYWTYDDFIRETKAKFQSAD